MMRHIEKHNRGLDDLICHPCSVIKQRLCTGPQISSHSSSIRWGSNNHPKLWFFEAQSQKEEKKALCKWKKALCKLWTVLQRKRDCTNSSYTELCEPPGIVYWRCKWWLQSTSHTWNSHKCTARRLVASSGVARHKQVPLCHFVTVGPPALGGSGWSWKEMCKEHF